MDLKESGRSASRGDLGGKQHEAETPNAQFLFYSNLLIKLNFVKKA